MGGKSYNGDLGHLNALSVESYLRLTTPLTEESYPIAKAILIKLMNDHKGEDLSRLASTYSDVQEQPQMEFLVNKSLMTGNLYMPRFVYSGAWNPQKFFSSIKKEVEEKEKQYEKKVIFLLHINALFIEVGSLSSVNKILQAMKQASAGQIGGYIPYELTI